MRWGDIRFTRMRSGRSQWLLLIIVLTELCAGCKGAREKMILQSWMFRRFAAHGLNPGKYFARGSYPGDVPSGAAIDQQSSQRKLQYYDSSTATKYSSASGTTSTETGKNRKSGIQVDNDEFFHWLEMAGILVGIILAVTAVSFFIYCLVYPLILCCSCVQSEADAFHAIDTLGPSESYSIV